MVSESEEFGVPVEEFLNLPEEKPERASRSDEIIALITNNPMTCSQIAEKLGMKYATAYSILTRLVKAGKVAKRYKDGVPYYAVIP